MTDVNQTIRFFGAVFGGDASEGDVAVCRADDAVITSRDPDAIAEFVGGTGEAWVSVETRDDDGKVWEQPVVAMAIDRADVQPAPSMVLSQGGDLFGIWFLTDTLNLRKQNTSLKEAMPLPGFGGWEIIDQNELAYPIADLEKAFAPAPAQVPETAVVLHGTLDPEFLARPLALTLSPHGSKTMRGRWRDWSPTVGEFLGIITKHKVGEKDGNCFLQGSVVGGERLSTAVKSLDLLILDLDTGESLDALRQKVMDLGLAAVLYTTHSNMKPSSQIKKDELVRWKGDDSEITTDDVCAYLISEKRYQPHVLEGAKLLGTEHTAEGIKLNVSHAPMEKFRLVLFLKDQFVVADRANTQREAITEWKERYAGLSKLLGAYYDRSCVDPSRLFFAPRHKKGAEWRVEVVAGGLLDLDNVDRLSAQDAKREAKGAFAAAAAEMVAGAGGSYKTENLKRFFAKYGATFDLESWLAEVDPDGDRGTRPNGPGRTHRCPNDDAHTNAGDEQDMGFFCVNGVDSQTGQSVAKCMHDSCADLDRLNFVDLICERVGVTDAMTGLAKWLPVVDEEEEQAAAPAAEAAAKAEPDEGASDKPYSNVAEATQAVKNLDEGDDTNGVVVAQRIGRSGFSPIENSKLKNMLSVKTGLGKRDLDAEFKAARRTGAGGGRSGTGGPEMPPATLAELNGLNDRFAWVGISGKSRILEYQDAGKAPKLWEVRAWMECYQNSTVVVPNAEGDNVPQPLSKVWMSWKDRKTFDSVIFEPDPSKSEPKCYNFYNGLAVVPKKGDWSLMKDHAREILCRDNKPYFDWVMTFLSQMVQQPGKKMGSSLVIIGKKGTGKSIFFDYFSKLWGEHAITVAHRSQITGQFNSHQVGKIPMICEEAVWAGDPQAQGVLKNLITNDRMSMEKKGLDIIEVANYVRLIMISNEEWVVPASLEDERRFFVLECSDDRRGDLAYFNALVAQMENGGLAAMAYDLLHYVPEGGDFECLRKPPETIWLKRQGNESMSVWDRFFFNALETGVCEVSTKRPDHISDVTFSHDQPNYIPIADIFWHYQKFTTSAGGHRAKSIDFGHFLRLAVQWFHAKGTTVNTDKWGFGGEKMECLVFPSLSEAKRLVVEKTGLEFHTIEEDNS